MEITKNDWKRRLIANPLVNQNTIRRILAIRRMAQTSIEKDPTDLLDLISLYWERYPMRGVTVTTKVS